jgi:hypothetical protein
MTKQIVSFSLTEDAIAILDNTSKAIGKSRSDFLELILRTFNTPEMQTKVKQINNLQNLNFAAIKSVLNDNSEVKQRD